MRIKKLELVGFKSFKDRTVIHYDAGITGIVGPNGCGKSNIVDALVWVMGEMSAKHLRGSSMEDVIFAGAEGYAPMGMAEVSLTLENDGGPFPVKYLNHSEIMITRRLHRSGESEYLINKEPARLRDIHEIFMDTGAGSKGFSIIEQGAIGRIVTAKPEERRTLIEEAAGITKFKARKRESQRRLKTTEANLVRLQDIISELKRQIDSLQRQAQRAERYRKLKTEIEDIELWVASVEYQQLNEKTENAQRTYDEAKEQEVTASAELSQIDALLQTLKADLAEQERQIQIKQQANKDLNDNIRTKEKGIQELHFEIEQAKRSKEMTGNLAQESQTRQEILNRDLMGTAQRLENITEEAKQIHEQYVTKKNEYEDSQAKIKSVDAQLTDNRRELLSMVQAETTLESRVLSLKEAIEEFHRQEEEEQNLLKEIQTQHQSIEQNYKKVNSAYEKERQLQLEIVNDVETLRANRDHIAQDLEHRTAEMNDFKDRLNEVTSRLYGLEDLQDNFEGFQEGVKSVMLWQKQKLENLSPEQKEQAQSYVPMAEVVEVPKEYEIAMEAALGPRMQLVLSPKNQDALQAVDYLKGHKSGRSSFCTSDSLQVVPSADLEPLRADSRVKALLKDVVTIPEKHKELVERILDRVAIVESISDALELKKTNSGWTFVTSDGDVVTEDGLITGGSAEEAGSGVLKRQREIKELQTAKDEWASKLSLAQVTLEKVENTYKQITEDLEQAQKNHTEKEILIAGLKKDLERAESELQNANKAVEKQQLEIDKIFNKRQEKSDDLENQEQHLLELREKKLEVETQCEKWTAELEEARSGIDSLQAEVTRLQVEDAKRAQEKEGIQREHDMLKTSLEEIEERLSRMTQEAEKNNEFVSENAVLLEEKKIGLEVMIRKLEEEEEALARDKNTYEEKYAEFEAKQESVSGQLAQRSQLQATMNEAQLQLEQAKMKEGNLTEQIREKYQLELGEVYRQHLDHEGDFSEASQKLSELKGKLHRIGEVNLSAIEEYDEISERYEFLTKQYDDLIHAKDQLRKVIDRINRICSRRFKETFEAVNSRFQKVFPVLFGGGEAHLILIEDPEKEEMGIDIVSRPPGKKLQSVSLLSGGEKALTAVSLIFSIFLVKPSPYCLLDEVDAPLDDANVMRFNELVKEMSKRSQIIVVTHNKYTMEVAEKLYGVTMEEKGVSKMVSVDLASQAQLQANL